MDIEKLNLTPPDLNRYLIIHVGNTLHWHMMAKRWNIPGDFTGDRIKLDAVQVLPPPWGEADDRHITANELEEVASEDCERYIIIHAPNKELWAAMLGRWELPKRTKSLGEGKQGAVFDSSDIIPEPEAYAVNLSPRMALGDVINRF
jgi:hypothetical protein